MNKLITLAICALIYLGASAQSIPNTFTYQGRCDKKNTDIEIEFTLKDASDKAVYSEKKTVHTSEEGTYSVILGGGQNWSSIDWKSSGYKLATKINDTELAECEIVSVPYANMAADVIGLDNLRSDIELMDARFKDEIYYLRARSFETQEEIDQLKDKLESSNSQTGTAGTASPNSYDKLNGKKWYVLGDSFSEGDWTGYETPIFSEGLYKGQKKVYPYFIGNRTGIEVHNLAKCGMTLSYYGDYSVLNVYKNIPEDADYVTIYIGINDSHKGVSIGDANSTNIATFLGAYNTVLDWLVTNRPYTHIGVIVSPSSNEANWSQFRDATIQAAQNYGVPVLDICGSDDIPYFLRQSEKKGVLDSVRALRDKQYRVGDNNFHPNERAHELQSHFIEEFLKRI